MGDGSLHDFGLLFFLVLFLAIPLTVIAVLELIKAKGKFSLLSVLTAATVISILLGYASYVFRN
jgi:hypothetical protein